MSDGFTLSVPADAEYRGLASELAGRFARLAGGSDADAAAVSAAVADAADRAATAARAEILTLDCRNQSSGLGLTLRFAGDAVEVHHPLPARNA
jgi:hypothetical protein